MADPKLDDWEEVDDWVDVDDWEEAAAPVQAAPEEDAGFDPGAFAQGAGQGVTFGFGEEGSAGLQTAAEFLTGQEAAPRTVGRGLGAELDPRSRYEISRDIQREDIAQAQEASPGSFLAGEVLGGAATAPVTGGAGTALRGGQAASRLGRLGAAVGEGVAVGALEGAGRSEADVGSEEFMGDVAFGSAVGGALPAGTAALGAGVRGTANLAGKAGDLVSDYAKQQRLIQMGAGKLQRESQIGRGGVDEMMELVEPGTFTTAPPRLQRAQAAKAKAGQEMERATRAMEQEGIEMSGHEVAGHVREKLIQPLMRGGTFDLPYSPSQRAKGGDRSYIRQLQKSVDELRQGGPWTFRDAREEATALFDERAARAAGQDPSEMITARQAKEDVRRALRDYLGGKVGEIFGDAEAAAFRKAGKEYALTSKATEFAEQAVEAGPAQRLRPDMTAALLGAGGVIPTSGMSIPTVIGATAPAFAGVRAKGAELASKGVKYGADLIGDMIQNQSLTPEAQAAARRIGAAWQTPGIAGAVEYYKEMGTSPELREAEEEERNGTYSR